MCNFHYILIFIHSKLLCSSRDISIILLTAPLLWSMLLFLFEDYMELGE
uniref:Uncharacterized protein n=1 Tax=Anguilla anguilla TaxID=7936 RepID=A0A0E9XQF3_ANGAN